MMRSRLPNRREKETETILFGKSQIPVAVSWGMDDGGEIREVFIDVTTKAGSEFSSYARDTGLLISIAVQHGATIQELSNSVTRTPEGRPDSLAGVVLDRLVERAAE